MTAVLSDKQLELLQSVQAKGDPGTEQTTRDHLGALKRMGLVELDRTDKGETWKLTDAGKAALKAPVSKADQPSGAELDAGELDGGAGQDATSSTPTG